MNNNHARVRAVIYARISEDPSGQEAGVKRQVKAAKERAEREGWDVIDVITDNDISALKGDHRPGYAEILRLVRLGKVDRVVVWQSSRLLRNRRERAEAIELFAKHRVGIVAVKGVSLDMSTAYGRGQAGILGEFDTMESEVKSERILAAAAERAAAGRPSGNLGYGWTKHGTGSNATWTEHPHQAAIVREIVDRILKGETLNGITADLNNRGEPAPMSAKWGKTTVKKLALREANIAQRVHHRGRDTQVVYDGCWPAIVDADKHARVRAKLSDPRRRTNGLSMDQKSVMRPGARRHLLSWGVGECGVCGGYLRAIEKRGRYGKPVRLYICDDKGCVGRNEDAVDALTGAVVVERMSRPDAMDLLLGDQDEARRWHDKVEGLRARLDEAADMFAAGDCTREQLKRINAQVKPELAEAEDQARKALVSLDLDVLKPLAGPGAKVRWSSMTVSQKRTAVESLGMRVIVDPTSHRGPVPRDTNGNPVPPDVRIAWS